MRKNLGHNSVWITWEFHTRSRSLSENLNVPLYEVVIKGGAIKRYVLSLLETLKIIKNRNIETVFFQNPSLVLALFLVSVNPFFKKKLIMDAHNSAIWPFEGKVSILNYIASVIIKGVDLSIVTNEDLKNHINNLGASAFVLPDPIPCFDVFADKKTKQKSNWNNEIVYICSWSDDEPYDEVIEAARLLKTPSTIIRITGNSPKKMKKIELPKNVVLEGFVPENNYKILIKNADLILDLTKRENCLVCGAYEAVAVGTPGILSLVSNSQKIFNKGFVFTENERNSIAESIDGALFNKKFLEDEIVLFKKQYSKNYEILLSSFVAIL